MDDHGTGAAMVMAHQIFEQASRRTGRTARMIARCEPGDRIITFEAREARRLKQLLVEAGKSDVDVRAFSADKEPLYRAVRPGGATRFDHNWVENFWRYRIRQATEDLVEWEAALSIEPLGYEWNAQGRFPHVESLGHYDWSTRRSNKGEI